MTAPVNFNLPLDRLPPELDGSAGRNRNTTSLVQINASNDAQAIDAWLDGTAAHGTKTAASYRKEAERLHLWAVLECGKPLSSLSHDDLMRYADFLEQPAAAWVRPSTAGRNPARHDPAWRPFAKVLSPASKRQALVILNGMYSWLVTAGYLAGNPLALSRTRRSLSRAGQRPNRLLTADLWNEVKITIESLPRETSMQRMQYVRARWIFSLLFLCGLRISEVAGAMMGDFYDTTGKEGNSLWWLSVLGKGQKLRLVPVVDDLLIELARYRRELGLTPYPMRHERTPAVMPLIGRPENLSTSALHTVIKGIFIATAARIAARGPDWQHVAAQVATASAHWMRHTSASEMANNGQMSLTSVRDNLGHGNLSTTSLYLHTEDEKRHAETNETLQLHW